MSLDIIWCLFYSTWFLGSVSSGDEIVNLVVEQDSARKHIIEKLRVIRTVIVDGYTFLSRTSAAVAMPFKTYRNVAVIHYDIPNDVMIARFSFQVEDQLLGIGTCDPENVFIHLKHGSYPAVNPDGYAFPQGFIAEHMREKIHTIQLRSNGGKSTYEIVNPRTGGWYAIAYVKLKDSPNIEQKGLAADCDAILYSDLQVKMSDVKVTDCFSEINIDIIPKAYKCMSNNNVAKLTLKLKIMPTSEELTMVTVKIQGMNLPSEDVHFVHCYVNLPMNDYQSITFQPRPKEWHYIYVEKAPDDLKNLSECNSLEAIRTDDLKYSIFDLTKDNKQLFFFFEYNLPSTNLLDPFSVLKITSNTIYVLRFNIHATLDIGGTLALTTSLLMTLKYQLGYKRKPLMRNESLLEFSEDEQFFKVIICQDLGYSSVPMSNGSCLFNGSTKQALFVLNSTDSDTIDRGLFIPFPEGGDWYLSVRLFCDEVVCPCRVSREDGMKYYVETDPMKSEEYRKASGAINDSRAGVSECTTTIKFAVSSMPCVFGKCSDRGSCMFVMSGPTVLSACYCSDGYGGWDCSDSSRMDSPLLSVLLLTLSNLFFLVSIYFAIIHKYYTEAVIYTFAMIMSTFYHACEAPIMISFCMMNKDLLQFGDFYCGIMSFWVTLLAISIMDKKVLSVLQIAGAAAIALLVTWSMFELMSFVIPVATGLVIGIVTWALDYKRNRVLYYSREFYFKYLPTGLAMVTLGLVCFAFLQTEKNYKYVHSVWHVLIALSVACLLPQRRENPLHLNV